jgi:hypothetical protein
VEAVIASAALPLAKSNLPTGACLALIGFAFTIVEMHSTRSADLRLKDVVLLKEDRAWIPAV